jgi:hypothetical protein
MGLFECTDCPLSMLQESQTERRGTEDDQQEAMFFVPAQTQWTCIQRLSPKNKGISPYIPLQAGNRGNKTRFNPYMVTCNSVGYFTLVLSAPLPLVPRDPLHVWIL